MSLVLGRAYLKVGHDIPKSTSFKAVYFAFPVNMVTPAGKIEYSIDSDVTLAFDCSWDEEIE